MNLLSRLFCPAAFFLLGAAHPVTDPARPPSPTAYYSTGNGDFHDPGFWNTAADGSGASATYPTPDDDDVFIIQSSHTVTITAGNVNALGVVIEGTLELSSAGLTLTLSDGQAGADLLVNGTYLDNGSSGNGTTFNPGASWVLGNAGTFIKTNNSSAAVYRDHYEGGMTVIPATAHWILRYTGAGDPTFTSEGDTWYPNLTIESFSGHWDPASSTSRFEGDMEVPRIKGSLDVGGNGSGTVTLYTEHTNSTPIGVAGNLIIRAGSTLTNNGSVAGTGLSVAGDLSLEGTLDFGSGSGGEGTLALNGLIAQAITGSGTVVLNNLSIIMGFIGDIYLQRSMTVNNLLVLQLGFLHLDDNELTLAPSAAIGGGNIFSYVVTDGTGTLGQTLGPDVFRDYPVGLSSYNPILLGNFSTVADDYRVRVEDLVYSNGNAGPAVTDKVVDRTWFVSSSTPADENLTVAMQWFAIDELSGFDRTDCYVSKYEGGWGAAPAGAAGGTDPYNRDRTGITSLSTVGTPFAIASGGVLPVEWFDFRVKAAGAAALLEWATLSERSNAGFSIERSNDERPFEAIGFVPGNGDSDVPRAYTFTDIRPAAGWNYYRIQQMDWDGAYSYSPVRTLWFGSASGRLRLWPIPAQDWVQVDMGVTGPANWTLWDLSGRRIRSGAWPEDAALHRVDLAGLPAGGYVLEVRSGEKRMWGRVVKGF